jgi:hypothetical protein
VRGPLEWAVKSNFIWREWSIGSGVEVQTNVIQQTVGNTTLATALARACSTHMQPCALPQSS